MRRRPAIALVAFTALVPAVAIAGTRGGPAPPDEPLATLSVATFLGPFNCDPPTTTRSRLPRCTSRTVAATVLVHSINDGRRVLKFSTGADGRATPSLPAGTYEVRTGPRPHGVRRAEPPPARQVTLAPGARVDVILDFDTRDL